MIVGKRPYVLRSFRNRLVARQVLILELSFHHGDGGGLFRRLISERHSVHLTSRIADACRCTCRCRDVRHGHRRIDSRHTRYSIHTYVCIYIYIYIYARM